MRIRGEIVFLLEFKCLGLIYRLISNILIPLHGSLGKRSWFKTRGDRSVQRHHFQAQSNNSNKKGLVSMTPVSMKYFLKQLSVKGGTQKYPSLCRGEEGNSTTGGRVLKEEAVLLKDLSLVVPLRTPQFYSKDELSCTCSFLQVQ